MMSMISKLALFLAVVPLALVSAATHNVQVGPNGKFIYDPPYVNAHVGDQVTFHFNPKNHTLTQSSLAAPCTFSKGGIDSKFVPVANTSSLRPTFTVKVKDMKPLWFYCRQGAGTPNAHCGLGMVFAINPGPDGAPNSFAQFQKAANATLNNTSLSPTPSPGSATDTVTNPKVYKVIVGGPNKLTFDPPRLAAKINDIVTFEFHEKNHTATRSTLENPCARNNVHPLDSGFKPVASDATAMHFPTWNVTVKSTNPVYFYCRQVNHCKQGMVFAINSDEKDFATFQARAKGTNASTGNGNGNRPY